MKKICYLITALIMIIAVSGCTKVGQGNYKEGTYFGFDPASRYTATIYVNENGLIKSVFLDAAYATENDKGESVATTKQILGNDYNMKPVSKIGKEWYEQVEIIADKVIAEQGLDWLEYKYRITDDNGNYQFTTAVPEGKTEADKKYTDSVSGVTISVNQSYAAIEDALNKAQK